MQESYPDGDFISKQSNVVFFGPEATNNTRNTLSNSWGSLSRFSSALAAFSMSDYMLSNLCASSKANAQYLLF
jgi:hypothetical protein